MRAYTPKPNNTKLNKTANVEMNEKLITLPPFFYLPTEFIIHMIIMIDKKFNLLIYQTILAYFTSIYFLQSNSSFLIE